ncbi:MAG: hypothetical protein HRU19_32240 [Pseudobacteriovorax sp.]|nr:hypothetical protein [Pseudobacteriovorax sp.]
MKVFLSLCLASIVSTLSMAQSTITSHLHDGRCVSDYCVVFSINIHMDSYLESPLTVKRSHIVYANSYANEYNSVVSRAGDTCSKDVTVPRDTFNAIQTIMRSISGADGNPAPVLTPTQQALILFYTTIMQQTLGFECDQRDLDPTILDPDEPTEGGGNDNTSPIIHPSN